MKSITNNLKIANFYYYNQNLNLIPITYGEKSPSIAWKEFTTRRSTEGEIKSWFGDDKLTNFGAVHGQFDDRPYYIAIDIDHDPAGEFYQKFSLAFPDLVTGWVERSGSGQGIHIPLWLMHAPQTDSGRIVYRFDNVTELDIRIHTCQTVLPPSLHPTGGRYTYIQRGEIAQLRKLDDLLSWANEHGVFVETKSRSDSDFGLDMKNTPGTLAHAVLQHWSDCLMVFRHFGYEPVQERAGNYRVYKEGGLLITEDGQKWHNHTTLSGGGPIQAWGYCTEGTQFTNQGRSFYMAIAGMAMVAGIDPENFKQVDVPKQRKYFNTLKHRDHPILSRIRI